MSGDSLTVRLSRYECNVKKRQFVLGVAVISFTTIAILIMFGIWWVAAAGLRTKLTATSFVEEAPQWAQEHADRLPVLLHELLLGLVESVVVWVAAPMLVLLGCIYISLCMAERKTRRALFNRPALVEQMLELNELLVTVQFRWISRAFVILTVMLLVAIVLSWMGSDIWVLYAGFAACIALLILGLLWIRAGSRSRRLTRTTSPLYARRACLGGFCRLVALAVGVGVVVGAETLLNRSWQVSTAPRIFDNFDVQIDAWATELRQTASDTALYQRKVEVLRVQALNMSAEMRKSSAEMQLFEEGSVTALEFWSLIILIVCLFAYLDVGGTLLRTEVRNPVWALAAMILLVVTLEWASSNAGTFLRSHGYLNYPTHLALVLAIYVAGQLSAFAVRLKSEKREICPRCSFPADASDERCGVCGTRLERLRSGLLIGSSATRELHHPGCHYAKRITAGNRREFLDVEEAYWGGFDNCAHCLGGSEYRWRGP